jgi:hypothetical protein
LQKNENTSEDTAIEAYKDSSPKNEKFEEYENWLENRKKVRHDLSNMGLNLEYLKRKKDLTELEKRVLRRMMFIDQQTQTDEMVPFIFFFIFTFKQNFLFIKERKEKVVKKLH